MGHANRIEATASTANGEQLKISASGHAADGLEVTLYGDDGIRIELPGDYTATRIEASNKMQDGTHVELNLRGR